jgi:hypothetical protein
VFPLEYKGALGYSHLELTGSKPPAARSAGGNANCEATLEKWVGRRYEELWRKPLVNDVSPVSALVSDDDGSFVTFDNWGPLGFGDDDVIVIYTGSGDLVKKFALRDIMTEKEYENFVTAYNNFWIDSWGGKHILGQAAVVVRVTTSAEKDEEKRTYRDVRISLVDGSLVK